MNKYYNTVDKEGSKYKVRDLIFHISENLITWRSTKKFNHIMLRLFKITKVSSPIVIILKVV
jgi:hypothetical protein